MGPASTEQLRRTNTALVLRSLREAGPLSRASIAGHTGLAKATVGTIVADLSERSVVSEGELTVGGRGRPGRPVTLSPGGVLGLGAEVNVDYVSVALVDLAGDAVLTRTQEVSDADDPLERVETLVAEVVAGTTGPVVGAGLAVPGLVERDHSSVAWTPNLGWSADARPGERLSALLDLPVTVDNDANLAAIAESTRGAGVGASSMLYLTGSVGIGGGIVQDGAVVRGAGFAGEVGHMPIGDLSRRCGCGRHGCWEASVGLRAALATLGMREVGTPMQIAADIAASAQEEPRVAEALGVLGARVGHGLATLCTVLDPATVVLGGYFQPLAPWILPAADEVLRHRLLASADHRPRLQVGALGIEAAALGAAEQALAGVLDGTVAL